MKKLFLILPAFLFIMSSLQAQKNVALTPGTLSTALNASELSSTTQLTITGTMDARDFKTIRESMPALTTLDLSGVNISAYTGTEGTEATTSISYVANSIPQFAFYNQDALTGKASLTSIVFPTSINAIGQDAFNSCTGLATLNLPANVKTLAKNAFKSCTALTSLSLTAGLTDMGTYTFEYCTGLKTVTLPATITKVGAYSFDGCDALTTVNLPSTITAIEDRAFKACEALATINFPESLLSIGNLTFYRCKSLTTIKLGSKVTTLSDYAFQLCSGAKTLELPASITSMGTKVFLQCTGLESITAKSATPLTAMGADVFMSVPTSTCKLYVPVGSVSAYQSAPQWSSFTTIAEIPSSINSVDFKMITIYPNPVTTSFSVDIDEDATVSVYAVNGNLVFNQQISGNEKVDISSLSSGVYFVKIETAKTQYQQRLIKE